MSEMDEFFVMGKAGDIQQMKASWFEIFVKGPLKYMLFSLLDKYPEPSTSNCRKKNSLAWLKLRDLFLKCEQNPMIAKITKLCFDVIIGEAEHDPPYEERLDFLGEHITLAYLSRTLAPRNNATTTFWAEPEINFRYKMPILNIWLDIEDRLANSIDQGDLGSAQNLITSQRELLSDWRKYVEGIGA